MNKRKEPYILWLPSWYPNKFQPFDGDFIQRHAKAASLYDRIVVISFPQYGEFQNVKYEVDKKVDGNLQEAIVYIPFTSWRIPFLDRIRYNIRYYLFARKFLKLFFIQNGLPEIVHVHIPMKAGNLALWIKKKFHIPFILSEQSSTYLATAPDNFYKRHWIYRRQVSKIFKEASRITNVSKAVGNILQGIFAIKVIDIIHNVVDTAIFRKEDTKFDGFSYIHVSSLSDQKNIYGILRCFHMLFKLRNDWRLILIGPYTNEVAAFINIHGLEKNIELKGEITYESVAYYLKRSHVFVLFSKHENFPCVVVEALCCGLPVVSSDVAGISEAVDVSNGILVGSEDEDALLKALLKVREKYDEYNSAIIAADAEKRFSYPVIAKKFNELYRLLNVRKGIG
jgi:glycosyltransferase involved in cell wall biosynthesis